jgi:hypothetical protein
MLHQKGNESCGILTCTGELGVLGSTQVVVVGVDHNHLHRIPLEPDDQSKVQLMLAALIKTKIAYCHYKHCNCHWLSPEECESVRSATTRKHFCSVASENKHAISTVTIV